MTAPPPLDPTVAEMIAPWTDAPPDVDAARAAVEAAYRDAKRAAAAGAFVDLALAGWLRDGLLQLLDLTAVLDPALGRWVRVAARYYAEPGDRRPDLDNAWGFDDDRTVVEEVVRVVRAVAPVHLHRPPDSAPRIRRRRGGERALSPLAGHVLDALEALPEPVEQALRVAADAAVARTAQDGVGVAVASLRRRVDEHLARAKAAATTRTIDLATATRLATAVRVLLDQHAAGDIDDAVLPLVLGAGELFVRTADEQDDFASAFGFDDDAAAVHAVVALLEDLRGAAKR